MKRYLNWENSNAIIVLQSRALMRYSILQNNMQDSENTFPYNIYVKTTRLRVFALI